MTATGDCFAVAARLVMDMGDPWVLCHGEPVWRGGDGVQRMAHAWVENVDAGIVIDRANGHDLTLPVALYYRAGDIGAATVKRYTVVEAANLMLLTGTYGPWHAAGLAAS